MDTEAPFEIHDATGDYTAARPVTADEILHQARLILEERFKPGTKIESPTATRQYIISQIGHCEREIFAVLFLDTRHQVLAFEKMFYGTIDGAEVHPREIAKRALALNAAAVILTHNHPSGVPEPSAADERITQRLCKALKLLNIRLLDHVVVGGSEAVSMAERGFI